MAKKQLDTWITESLSDLEKDGACTAFALVHMRGSGQEEIDSIKIGSQQIDPKTLANRFQGKAETSCQNLNGTTQMFRVLAFYADRPQPSSFYPFSIHVDSEENLYGLSEGPDKAGQTMQIMRHTENLAQGYMRGMAHMLSEAMQTNRELSQMNRSLISDQYGTLEIVRKLTLDAMNQTHEFRMKELTFQRESEERAMLLKFAPSLLNSITGREIFPQGTADTALIENLVNEISKMSAEEIEELAKKLPPMVWAPIADRAKEILKNKKLQREQGQRLIESGLDPEKDARGD